MKPPVPSDTQILEGIKSGNKKILNFLYSEFFPEIDKFVNANSGNTFEARDVFQEAIYSVYLKVYNGNLQIKRSFGAYFFTVCKNLWYAIVRDRKYNTVDIDKLVEEIAAEQQDLRLEINELRKNEIYISAFNKLDKKCSEIIEMSMGGYSIKEIMKALNLSSEGFTRQKKSRCYKKLYRLFENDPGFKAIIDEKQ